MRGRMTWKWRGVGQRMLLWREHHGGRQAGRGGEAGVQYWGRRRMERRERWSGETNPQSMDIGLVLPSRALRHL